ncbi:ModE family transcriptional regulator [Sphingomonas oleivorans]|uniref:ModE family transcriptional regulator n=1 Tax=Sphingomonas oleivorans TaxID=1735121 RepID=A0A2T5FWZ0_9SPHN|nr:LysR family transcriptional regulator [Sphingomonas oleivorans]PTQ10288.1 ModE family transcriptional regulator [Sphingomonas oleivorans]
MADPFFLKLKAQLFLGSEIAIGPGKAALLEAIAEHGSISAAGRVLGMSYRRTWLLVDVMNRCWAEPLVEAAAGGSKGGGAALTETGRRVLESYRAIEQRIAAAAECPELDALKAMLLPIPR